jgi:hypothetical protein
MMFVSMPMADFQAKEQEKAVERITRQLREMAREDPTMYFDGGLDTVD